jgi:hypothetical protein
MEKQIVQAGLCRMVKRAHHARKFEERLIPRVEMQRVSISAEIYQWLGDEKRALR